MKKLLFSIFVAFLAASGTAIARKYISPVNEFTGAVVGLVFQTVAAYIVFSVIGLNKQKSTKH